MAWFKADVEAWEAAAATIEGKWARAMCVLDLAYWKNRCKMTGEPFPRGRVLGQRWGWTKDSAQRLLKKHDPENRKRDATATQPRRKSKENSGSSERNRDATATPPHTRACNKEKKKEEEGGAPPPQESEPMSDKMEPECEVVRPDREPDVDALLREYGLWRGSGLVSAPVAVEAVTAMDACGGPDAFKAALRWATTSEHREAVRWREKPNPRWKLRDLPELDQVRRAEQPDATAAEEKAKLKALIFGSGAA